MELIIIFAVIAVMVFFIKRTFKGLVYSVVIVDIFLRILSFVNTSSNINIFKEHLPVSIPSLINKYLSGTFNTIAMWALAVIYIVFEFSVIKSLLNKKR